MTAQAEFAELQFKDGDRVQIFEKPFPHAPERYQAVFGEKAILFYGLHEDGTRPVLPVDERRIERRADSKLLGETNYELYVRPDGDDRLWWYGDSTSTVTNLNAVAQSQLQPWGAHSLPIILMDADQEDGLFSNRLMTEAIADGVFIFATNARSYRHDTRFHGRGVISLETNTADVLRSICQLALLHAPRYPQLDSLMDGIVNTYDLCTYQYSDQANIAEFGQLQPINRDPLLTRIMWWADEMGTLPNSFMAQLLQIIEAGPFTYNIGKHHVRRFPVVKQYYESISELVA